MKIQCSCGAKYDFDVTPEMAQEPVRFVCPNCGLDSSDFVNDLIRNEIAEQFPDAATPPPAAPQLKISHPAPPAEPPTEASTPRYCPRHRTTLATGQCVVCGNPICPQCMELFGYFCSPLCKNKAELQGIAAPVYAGQKFRVEARFWRKTWWILGSVGAVAAVAMVLWILFLWFSSVPRTYFSVRFDDTDRAYAGDARLVGKDQLVFLHGGTLARYDLKTKKPVWSLELITKEQIDDLVKSVRDSLDRLGLSGPYGTPAPGALERAAKIELQHELSLEVSDENIWVVGTNRATHYDWASGKVVREVPLPKYHGEAFLRKDELLVPGLSRVQKTSGAQNSSCTSTSPTATNIRKNFPIPARSPLPPRSPQKKDQAVPPRLPSTTSPPRRRNLRSRRRMRICPAGLRCRRWWPTKFTSNKSWRNFEDNQPGPDRTEERPETGNKGAPVRARRRPE